MRHQGFDGRDNLRIVLCFLVGPFGIKRRLVATQQQTVNQVFAEALDLMQHAQRTIGRGQLIAGDLPGIKIVTRIGQQQPVADENARAGARRYRKAAQRGGGGAILNTNCLRPGGRLPGSPGTDRAVHFQ